VIVGAGSSEILRISALALLSPQRKLVMADPTFEAIGEYAKAARAEVVKFPLDSKHGHDLEQMLDASGDAGLLYVCNPNNPTGTITPKDDVRKFIESVPSSTAILVDEAYHHYTTSDDYASVMPFVATHPNLIVARTFSKIYGMAGLRCGYAIGQRETMARLAAQQQWDSVNCVALAAARASLADKTWVADGRRRNSQTKQWLATELGRIDYRFLPSETNFVMIDTRREVRPLITALGERGVRVGRLFPARPQHLRVTIGTPEQMKRFVSAFSEVVKERRA
jgi:histidinol-phosphate aminotransferase